MVCMHRMHAMLSSRSVLVQPPGPLLEFDRLALIVGRLHYGAA